MTDSDRPYVPAAGHDWALPFYDGVAKILGADRARRLLAEQASCEPGDRVLEIGCGTGSLALLLKRTHPGATVIGLDPDPRALARARRKAGRAEVSIQFDQGFAAELPHGDDSFDLVASSFMFHHLALREKEQMLREVRRVLKPGGRFYLLDFAGPSSGGHGFLARRIHAHDRLRDNDEDRVLGLMRAAGLADPRVVGRLAARLAHTAWYQAGAPEAVRHIRDGDTSLTRLP